jgi:transposase
MLSQLKEIYLVSTPIDMRKSINSLTILINTELKENPSSGAGFVFYNSPRDKIKIFYFSGNGFVLFYKRFERSRVHLPIFNSVLEKINHVQLMAFLSGLEIENLKIAPPKIYTEF